MKVLLRNPRRELEVPGPMSVSKLLARLELNPESVLVIQGDTLVPQATPASWTPTPSRSARSISGGSA